jgi:hypothetical protein
MLETIFFAAISIIILGGCAYGLFYITRAYYPEIKEVFYAQWLNLLSRFRREPLVNGDIIFFEELIERPVSEETRKSLKVIAKEVYDAGFDNNQEEDRFINVIYKFRDKYHENIFDDNSDSTPS